jgi:hypothetical protein
LYAPVEVASGNQMNSNNRPTICNTVFNLPYLSAGRTSPLEAKFILSPSTSKSLIMNSTGIHTGILDCAAKITSTEFTRILSAIGSNSFPKFVTWLFFLARYPSSQSVAEAKPNNPNAKKLNQ